MAELRGEKEDGFPSVREAFIEESKVALYPCRVHKETKKEDRRCRIFTVVATGKGQSNRRKEHQMKRC